MSVEFVMFYAGGCLLISPRTDLSLFLSFASKNFIFISLEKKIKKKFCEMFISLHLGQKKIIFELCCQEKTIVKVTKIDFCFVFII
jgi:hypothetical protein